VAANTGTKIHGKGGAIYIAASGQAKTKVAAKSEWTLNLSRDYVDATVFGEANKTYLAGLKDVQGTYSGLLDVSGDLLVNSSSSDAIYIYLYADDATLPGGSNLLVAYGLGFVDASLTASNTDAVRTTGNFRAGGTWTVFSSGTLT